MAEEAKKPGFFKRAAASATKFLKDLRGETKKIVWPSKKQVVNNTWIVVVVVILSSIVIGLMDLVFNALVALFH